jgi:hypothetical protein
MHLDLGMHGELRQSQPFLALLGTLDSMEICLANRSDIYRSIMETARDFAVSQQSPP